MLIEIPSDYLVSCSGPSISAQQMTGAGFLNLGPVGNLASSQRLSSSLFHRPVDFHLFQRQKDEAFFGGDGQPLGPTAMKEKD